MLLVFLTILYQPSQRKMLDLNNRPASMLLMGHGDTRRGPKVEKAASAYAMFTGLMMAGGNHIYLRQ